MAQVILSMEEYREIEQLQNKVRQLKKDVKDMNIFADPYSCWNTEKDVIKAFTLNETRAVVNMILKI